MAAMDGDAPERPRGKRKGKSSTTIGEGALRFISDPRSERRFEPTTPIALTLTVIAASLASVALGAGVYGRWLRDEALGPYPYATHLIAAGVVVLVVLALFGPRPAPAIRVGDAGVGVEKDDGVQRIGWYEVTDIARKDDVLTFRGAGASIAIPIGAQRAAAAKALHDAKMRIPARAEGVSGDLGPVDPAAGAVIAIEPAQVAGLRCKKTGKLLSFEADVRLCRRCGEVYDKGGVPGRCVTCDAALRA